MRFKANVRREIEVLKQPAVLQKEGISSSLTDSDGPTRFQAVQTSELEIGANDNNSEIFNKKGGTSK